MRLGYIFENSEEIDFQCWISQKDFKKYRNEFTGEEKGNSSGIDGYYSVSVYDAFLPDTPLISAVNMGERSNV